MVVCSTLPLLLNASSEWRNAGFPEIGAKILSLIFPFILFPLPAARSMAALDILLGAIVRPLPSNICCGICRDLHRQFDFKIRLRLRLYFPTNSDGTVSC